MGGTSPGFPALCATSKAENASHSPEPRADGSLDAFFDAMSSSPTLPPATGPQRIERKLTPLPSFRAERDQRLGAAIAASARAQASLSGLFRAIQLLGAGVDGAREANELLTQELEALRDVLGAGNEQQLAFEHKVLLLEQALDRARKDGEWERELLTEQHDALIVDLMDEQEAELARRDRELNILRERLSEVEDRSTLPTTPPPNADLRGSSRMNAARRVEDEGRGRAERAELERTAQKLAEDRERSREIVQRLQAQRDEAQSVVTRISKERDDALSQVQRLKSELRGPRIPFSTRRPPVESPNPELMSTKAPPSASEVATNGLRLDALEIAAQRNRPSIRAPQLDVPAGRASSPSAASRPTAPAPAISNIAAPPHGNPLDSSIVPRLSPPPDELRGALTCSPALQPLGASSRPPLKQKPDVSTRPLVGYSVNDESVAVEQLEGVRLSKAPPRRDKR